MNLLLRRLVLAAACVATALAPRADAQGRAANRQVVVSAAVSLSEVLQQLAPAYQAATGNRLVLNVAASNTLARQISFGAGVDLFISADEAQMNGVAAYIDPAGSVRLALMAVESGAADAAIVYHTDMATAAHAREALLIRSAEGPRIVYPAAIVRAGKNQEGGRRLLAFLRSPDAIAVFTRAGFIAPVAARN